MVLAQYPGLIEARWSFDNGQRRYLILRFDTDLSLRLPGTKLAGWLKTLNQLCITQNEMYWHLGVEEDHPHYGLGLTGLLAAIQEQLSPKFDKFDEMGMDLVYLRRSNMRLSARGT